MILVSGGTGVMGSRLVRGLSEAGRNVRVLTLPGDPHVSRLEGVACEIVYGDVSDADTLTDIFDRVQTVYHLAAIIISHDRKAFDEINARGTRNMVEGASASGAEHFIYVSSASVVFPNASAYARSKMEGERTVMSQKRMHYTIVRPTLIYEKDGAQEFMMFLEFLKKYPVVPFVGRGRAKKNPVYADDLVEGLLAIADNPKTYGKIYNFGGGESISIWDLAHLMLKHQGMVKPFIPIPVPVCRLIAFMMEHIMSHPPLSGYAISRIIQDADPDSGLARQDLGYNPVGVTEGLQKCYPVEGEGYN